MKHDKEHMDSLSKYPELKERMQSLLQNGEKITPKQWKAEIQSLQSEYDSALFFAIKEEHDLLNKLEAPRFIQP